MYHAPQNDREHLRKTLVERAPMWCNALALVFTAGYKSSQAAESAQAMLKGNISAVRIRGVLAGIRPLDKHTHQTEMDKWWNACRERDRDALHESITPFGVNKMRLHLSEQPPTRNSTRTVRVRFADVCHQDTEGSPCHFFRQVYGFPCPHLLQRASESDATALFHRHWHLSNVRFRPTTNERDRSRGALTFNAEDSRRTSHSREHGSDSVQDLVGDAGDLYDMPPCGEPPSESPSDSLRR